MSASDVAYVREHLTEIRPAQATSETYVLTRCGKEIAGIACYQRDGAYLPMTRDRRPLADTAVGFVDAVRIILGQEVSL